MITQTSIRKESVPIERVISAACKNFLAFDNLQTFKFEPGINSIVGGNASGKTSLIYLIMQAISIERDKPWHFTWNPYKINKKSLIELKFIAGGKLHYVRKIIEENNTTDIHLYVGEGEEIEFYRDGEAIEYMSRFIPIFVVDSLEANRKDFYYWTSNKTTQLNPKFTNSAEIISGLNQYLPKFEKSIKEVEVNGKDVWCVKNNGTKIHITAMSGGLIKLIYVLGKVFNILSRIKEKNLSKVILVDELEMGLTNNALKQLNLLFKEMSEKHGCQFIVTSRYVKGRFNPIRLNKPRRPSYYRLDNMNNHLFRSHVFKNPPYNIKSTPRRKPKWKP